MWGSLKRSEGLRQEGELLSRLKFHTDSFPDYLNFEDV
jgi:hypothetical protein